MRLFVRPIILILFFLSLLNGVKLHGQEHTVRAKNGLNATPRNYAYFTSPYKDTNPEAVANNKGYEHHPELGMLFASTPCDNCYELIGSRTENSKTFIKEGTSGRNIMRQTATAPMHYKDAQGNWLTVNTHLAPTGSGMGTFSAPEQATQVMISPELKMASLGGTGQFLQFDRNLELVYAKPDGTEVPLGAADYSHYTAGDDGVYITNAWPGIDIELYVARGAVKTNFIINNAMPAYADGNLLVRDHLNMNDGYALYVPGQNKQTYSGNVEIKDKGGKTLYTISAATAYEKRSVNGTLQMLDYHINGHVLDIALPGNFLNRPASAYPVIIDPLVSSATNFIVSGSSYSPSWTTGCVYANPATVPAGITVTDVQFTFEYTPSGGARTLNGANDFKLGTCRSPSIASSFWTCPDTSSTSPCSENLVTIFPEISSCIPPPQCAQYDLGLTMDFYQDYAPAAACSPTYISALGDLTVTVSGHTAETHTITASPDTICQGQSTTLSATSYGVTPVSYLWAPGGLTGATVTVNPTATTTYTLTVTDACGNSSSSAYTVHVNPVGAISGTTTVCVGGSTTLSNIGGAGMWVSSNPAKATAGSSTGIVTGIATGSVVISYTSAAGCSASIPVTIKPAVGAISGSAIICQGSTTTLSDVSPGGGTWSSNVPAIATVGSTTGVATGVSGGTSIISYATFGAGCYAAITLTVNPLAPITGVTSICLGGSTTLSDAVPGGSWTSSNTTVATIGAGTGSVSSVSVGTSTITYTTPALCKVTAAMNVGTLSPITGTFSICQGSTSALSHPITGGMWTSANPSVAGINPSTGLVTGVSGGTAGITYTVPGGCTATTTVTINPIPPVSGTPSVCLGGTTTLSDGAGPGTWASSNTAIASAGTTTGVITGVGVGICTITYTSAAGCSANIPMNVSLATPITGITTVCQGQAVTLNDITAGGIWASANTAIATVGASTGIVTGVSGGGVAISYTNPSGCTVSISVSVNPVSPITGTLNICTGGTTALGDAIPAGSWNSGSPAVATIDPASGVVTSLSTGSAAITYTNLAGCAVSSTVTVNLPSPITGILNVCQGGTSTLSNPVSGGAWTSGSPAIATIDGTTGIVSGVTAGTATINYSTPGGCNATTTVTINAVAPVTGTASMCAGNSTTLSNALSGGSWSSINPAVASAGAATGIVSGISAGTATINYTNGSGCISGIIVTVNIAPAPIAGSTLLCTSTTLSDGVGGGTWISSAPAIATIGITSGVAFGLSPGTATITYTAPGGCATNTTLTVDPLLPITGTTTVCQGSTTTLSYPNPGGTWSSLNPAIANVASTGVVTGVSGGTTTISYVTSSGCIATVYVTVHPLLSVMGTPTVCQGSNTTLSDGTPGGSWTSSDVTVAPIGAGTGIVSGISAGTATISYTTTSGCIATTIVTVNPLDAITGISSTCAGNTITLSDATPAGTWSSTIPSVATVDPTGDVSGLSAGTTIIRYTTPTGCIAGFTFTVNALPGAIAGSATVCQGSFSTLSNSLAGGTWSSADLSVATIDPAAGLVTGITAGNATISYTTASGCFVTTIVTVNPLLPTTGSAVVCAGNTATLNNPTPGGGTWSSTLPPIATIDPVTGVVSGIAAGTVNIKFTSGLGCIANFSEVVVPLPSAIIGALSVCMGSTTTLSNSLAGGTWSSNNPAVATVGITSGVLAGVSVNTVTVAYTSAAGCAMAAIVTVNPLPLAITGVASICQGATTTMHDATASGAWSSLNPAVAAVDAAAGLVSGLSAGITYIKFSTPAGCFVTRQFTVNALPSAITGTTVLCEGATSVLSNTLAGGSWSSSNPATATIDMTSGLLSGISTGNTTITYITTAGCFAVTGATVNATPFIGSYSYTNPTTCVTTDGTIKLSGLTAGASYTVHYTFGGTPVTVVMTADGAGNVNLTGLAAGSYYYFSVTTTLGCTSNIITGPLALNLPPTPATPVANNNSPICAGITLDLTATDATPGVTYSWDGPGGYTSGLQNPTISNSNIAESGAYTVTATKLGCVSAPATTVAVVHPIPDITKVVSGNPTTCQGSDGEIMLEGLLPGVSYSIGYKDNGTSVAITKVADTSGDIIIAGLSAGSYADFAASSFTCISNIAGPVTLTDPNPAPAPALWSNSPICAGKTLDMTSADAVPDLIYDWEGPNGFSSNDQNPEIPNVPLADSGIYTLTIKHLNCPTTVTVNIMVHPGVTLTNVTPGQVVPLGGNIQLYASGAEFYRWTPNDGTLNNANIDSPVAIPQVTTVYEVQGMNVWGCLDTASVNIVIDDNVNEFVPNAFTPNNDGRNDIFRIGNVKYDKLVDFSIYNRWGQLVYHNEYEPTEGWDGKFNGVPQDMGTYYYNIILTRPDGTTKNFKGEVILIR